MSTPPDSPPPSSSPPTTREAPHRHREGGLDPDPPDPGILRGIPPHAFLVASLALAMVFTRSGGALLLVVSALLIVSAWAAWLLARLDARHRPVAQGLVTMVGCMLVREGLHAYVLHGGPYAGWVRAAFHLEEATRLATAALPAWMALRVLTRARMWIWNGFFVSVCGGLLLMLMVMYPWARGDVLRRVYLGAELAALFVALVAILSWVRRRGWVSRIDERSESAIEHLEQAWGPRARVGFEGIAIGAAPRWWTYGTVLVLVAGDLVLLIWGAWRWGLFGPAYVVQQAGLVGVWGIVALLHGAALVMARRRA